MKITYELTLKDLVEFNAFYYGQSATLKKGLFFTTRIFPAIMFSVMLILGLLDNDMIPIIIGIAIAAYLILIRPSQYRAKMRKVWLSLYAEDPGKDVLGKRELEILENGIFERTSIGERTIHWHGITKVEQTECHTFISFGLAQAYIIPKASMTEGCYDDFVAELKQRIT